MPAGRLREIGKGAWAPVSGRQSVVSSQWSVVTGQQSLVTSQWGQVFERAQQAHAWDEHDGGRLRIFFNLMVQRASLFRILTNPPGGALSILVSIKLSESV